MYTEHFVILPKSVCNNGSYFAMNDSFPTADKGSLVSRCSRTLGTRLLTKGIWIEIFCFYVLTMSAMRILINIYTSIVCLRFCFFNVSIDEVVVHEEQPQSNQVESDVHAMTQTNGLVKGSSKRTHGCILQDNERKKKIL